jgi:WD40 repeat protein
MAIGFAADRRLLAASAGHDGIARVYELASGRELAQLEEPRAVSAIAFDRGVQRVVTAGRDGTARAWAPA